MSIDNEPSLEIEYPPEIESPPGTKPVPELMSRQDKIITVALYTGAASVIALALIEPLLQ
jgi:hypothetical protein